MVETIMEAESVVAPAAEAVVDPHQATSWQMRRLNTRLGLGMKLFMAAGAALLFFKGDYQAGAVTLVILTITFLPLFMRNYFHVRIPAEFETLTVLFICLSLFLGEVQEFYLKYWWWDFVLHGGAGLLVGMTGFLLVYTLNQKVTAGLHLTPRFIAIFAFMFALGIGYIWELFEFGMDRFFGFNMQKSGLVDTMADMIVNLVGALLVSLAGYGYLRAPNTDSRLMRMVHKFTASNPRIFRRRAASTVASSGESSGESSVENPRQS
jgi:hypothetical protein